LREVIDFHVHAFPDKIAEKAVKALNAEFDKPRSTDGTIKGLCAQMDRQGITRSVILPVATKPEQVDSINSWVKEIKSDRIITFATIHPDYDNVESLIENIIDMGFLGIKIQADWIGINIDNPIMDKIYDCIGDRLIISFHMGGEIADVPTIHALPYMLVNVLEKHPNLVAIAAHMGGFGEWDNVWDTLIGRDLYMDTSSCFSHLLPDDKFCEMIKAHGADKILFASDNPMMEPEYPLAQILRLDLTEEEKDLILYKNAKKLLNLN